MTSSQLIQCPACEQDIPITAERCPNCNDDIKFHLEISGGAEKVIADQLARKNPSKHKKKWIIFGISLWLLAVVIVVRNLSQ